MTAIGSVNGPHASGPESEHCTSHCALLVLYGRVWECGEKPGVVQRSESAVDMCGIQGFSLITAKCQSEDVVARKQNKA